jgi:hypothetical protein
MAVLYANHFKLSLVDRFDALPVNVREALNGLKYIDIVLPLMTKDRHKEGLSYRQLSIKYGVAKSTIQRMVSIGRIK